MSVPVAVDRPDDVTLGWDWDRPVPPEWVAALHAAYPPHPHLPHLELAWMPGVDRWIVYELQPLATVHEDLQRACREPLSEYGELLSPPQRRLYDRTGKYGVPVWVVQGRNGGHPPRFSNAQQKLLKLAGKSPDAPFPGELPYAPFDQRVLDNLRAQDAWLKYGADLTRRKALVAASRRDEERAARKALVDWLETIVDRDVGRTINRGWSSNDVAAPVTEVDPTGAWERAKDSFINGAG